MEFKRMDNLVLIKTESFKDGQFHGSHLAFIILHIILI